MLYIQPDEGDLYEYFGGFMRIYNELGADRKLEGYVKNLRDAQAEGNCDEFIYAAVRLSLTVYEEVDANILDQKQRELIEMFTPKEFRRLSSIYRNLDPDKEDARLNLRYNLVLEGIGDPHEGELIIQFAKLALSEYGKQLSKEDSEFLEKLKT